MIECSNGVGEWCHPGDDGKQRWIIMYEDAEVAAAIYFDEDEARTAFSRAELAGWNCHLFTSVKRLIRNG